MEADVEYNCVEGVGFLFERPWPLMMKDWITNFIPPSGPIEKV
jgi:hypothetical protein